MLQWHSKQVIVIWSPVGVRLGVQIENFLEVHGLYPDVGGFPSNGSSATGLNGEEHAD